MGQVIRIKGLKTGDIGFGTVENPSEGGGGGGGGGTDTDAKAYIDYVTGLSIIQQSAVKTLVSGLKSKDLWTKISSIYPFLGTGATGRGANLKDISKNLTYVGYNATSEDVKGWKGVTGMYAKTGISSNWNNDFTYLHIPTAWTASDVVGISNETLSSTLAIIRQGGNLTMSAGLGAANYHAFSVSTLKGSFLATTNNGSADLYVDGANKKTVTYTPVATLTQLQIMAYRSGTAIAIDQLLSIVCVGNSHLTEVEVANFNTLIDAFLTSIGRK